MIFAFIYTARLLAKGSIQFGAFLDEISSFETWKIPINGDKGLSQNAFVIWCINPLS